MIIVIILVYYILPSHHHTVVHPSIITINENKTIYFYYNKYIYIYIYTYLYIYIIYIYTMDRSIKSLQLTISRHRSTPAWRNAACARAKCCWTRGRSAVPLGINPWMIIPCFLPHVMFTNMVGLVVSWFSEELRMGALKLASTFAKNCVSPPARWGITGQTSGHEAMNICASLSPSYPHG